ncbi:hypothetical protein ElyMa_003021800 [Elysia marginata]|uniref:Uncharacterized protein n=1 Tax=Elysia marginata TaxID=1093978 RepID=A0AAV4IF04_9GAST|nr:hypothetical protein ElyMa_003021800 [Elysia marginata]
MLPWAFRSKSLLSTIKRTRYPGSSGPRAYCLLLTNTLPSAFRSKSPCLPLTNTKTWAFRAKSLLSTIRPTRYPVSSGPRAYCLSIDRKATLGLPVQEPTVYP